MWSFKIPVSHFRRIQKHIRTYAHLLHETCKTCSFFERTSQVLKVRKCKPFAAWFHLQNHTQSHPKEVSQALASIFLLEILL